MRFAVRQPAASPVAISYSYQTSNAGRRLMFGKNGWRRGRSKCDRRPRTVDCESGNSGVLLPAGSASLVSLTSERLSDGRLFDGRETTFRVEIRLAGVEFVHRFGFEHAGDCPSIEIGVERLDETYLDHAIASGIVGIVFGDRCLGAGNDERLGTSRFRADDDEFFVSIGVAIANDLAALERLVGWFRPVRRRPRSNDCTESPRNRPKMIE